VVKLANTRLDDVRRRTHQETLGHRGHRDYPLCQSRNLLTIGRERLDDKGNAKLENLLKAALCSRWRRWRRLCRRQPTWRLGWWRSQLDGEPGDAPLFVVGCDGHGGDSVVRQLSLGAERGSRAGWGGGRGEP
jgi:hypothetical protein